MTKAGDIDTLYRISLTYDQLYFFYRAIGCTSPNDRIEKMGIKRECSKGLTEIYSKIGENYPELRERSLKDRNLYFDSMLGDVDE